MKKIKVILSVLMLSALFTSVFAKEKEPVEPVTVKLSAATQWENQATMQDGVYNSDGSVTYTSMFKYGGGGYAFNIDGKKGIDLKNYKTILIEFDYEAVEGWNDSAKFPKFGIKTWGPGTSFFQGGVGQTYPDADALSGTMTVEVDISAARGKALRVGVCSNAWKWVEEGGSEDDKVKITVKEITFLP